MTPPPDEAERIAHAEYTYIRHRLMEGKKDCLCNCCTFVRLRNAAKEQQ